MENIDFTQCEFIHENMDYLTYYDFCDNCYAIKELYNELDRSGKRFYKWYVYANIHMDTLYKDIIWDYLNCDDPIAYVVLINMKKKYKVR